MFTTAPANENTSSRGYSLFELITAIAIFSIVSAASGAVLMPVYFKYSLSNNVDNVLTIFTLAQQNSVAVNQGLEHGVSIDFNKKMVSQSPSGKFFKISSSIQMSTDPTVTELAFAKRTGLPLETPNQSPILTQTFVLKMKLNNLESGILVEPSGLITKLPIKKSET